MKHYICVEEHVITYICGTYKAPGRGGGRGTIVVQEAQSDSSGRGPEGIFAGWAAQYGLEGKRIVLVMGRGFPSWASDSQRPESGRSGAWHIMN